MQENAENRLNLRQKGPPMSSNFLVDPPRTFDRPNKKHPDDDSTAPHKGEDDEDEAPPNPPFGRSRAPPTPPCGRGRPPSRAMDLFSHADPLFVGSLGYGMGGDQCLYSNFPALSPSCQDAILDLHELRREYVAKDQQRGSIVVPLILLLLAALVTKKLMYRFGPHRKRRQQMEELLHTIHGNEELKKEVQLRTGAELPAVRSGEGKCIFQRCQRAAGYALSALLVLIGSAHLSAAALAHLYPGGPAPMPVAVAVLAAVTATTGASAIAVRRAIRSRAAAAPPPTATADTGLEAAPSTPSRLPLFFSFGHTAPAGYQPLPAAEMVTPNVPVVYYSPQPNAEVHVASPASAISMI